MRLIELLVFELKQITQTISVGVSQGLEVIFPMTRRREISGWKLTICASCIAGYMSGEIEHPHQAQNLIQKKTAATGRGQGLLLVSPSLCLHV